MGPNYADTLTLDRIDVNGPYSPENCRWATPTEQANNTRFSVKIETPDGLMTITEAANHYGLKKVTLHARIRRYGWSIERALTTPA
jgi:hypothetical protein